MTRREGIDLAGKRLIIVRKTGDDEADLRLARAVANGTGLLVCVLAPDQQLDALSDDDLERLQLRRITTQVRYPNDPL